MVILTVKEQLKLEVIQRIMDNQIEVSKAAIILGLLYSITKSGSTFGG
jgi:hypothetical protein